MNRRIGSAWYQRTVVALGLALLIGMVAAASTGTTVASNGRSAPGIRREPGHAFAPQTATTVWAGLYTEAQAKRGEEGYLKDCAPCHQKDLYGDEYAPALVRGTFYNRWTDLSVGDLYSVICSTMPQDAPGSLPTQEYIDIVSYLLKMNKMPAGQAELPSDQAKLKEIKILEKPRP
jgi:mono/diheme cytochrome c family protein